MFSKKANELSENSREEGHHNRVQNYHIGRDQTTLKGKTADHCLTGYLLVDVSPEVLGAHQGPAPPEKSVYQVLGSNEAG